MIKASLIALESPAKLITDSHLEVADVWNGKSIRIGKLDIV